MHTHTVAIFANPTADNGLRQFNQGKYKPRPQVLSQLNAFCLTLECFNGLTRSIPFMAESSKVTTMQIM